MKSLIVFAGLVCFVAAQGLTVEQTLKRLLYKVICQPQTWASNAEIAKAGLNDWSSEDSRIKEFNLCYFKLVGVMTSDGKFHKDVFLDHTPVGPYRDAAPALIDECLELLSSVTSAAELSWQFSRCYFTKNPHVLV